MNFTSLEFLVFFPVILLVYWRLPGRARWMLLLPASYLFYMNWNPWTGLLLLGATLVSYTAARQISAARDAGRTDKKGRTPRGWLYAAFVCCLGSLVFFKYTPGVSFYTFQTLSYVVDVYRGSVPCERHFGYYALFVSFFPQLVAGPIERPGNLLPQLKEEQRFSVENLYAGFWLMLQGFFKKIVVADYLSSFVEAAYAPGGQAQGLAVVLGTVFFAVQIYCDFSGYTDIARGCAQMMGVRLMENFRHPYRADSVRDFWRRWHISLSGWFADYVYIPLGGSREGRWKQCRNIMVVFLLSGLWHGASWNFVIWGLLHGCFLVWETLVPPKDPGLFYRGRTLLLVCASWVFFRADSAGSGLHILASALKGWSAAGAWEALAFLGLSGWKLLVTALVLLGFWYMERRPCRRSLPVRTGEAVRAAVSAYAVITATALFWLLQLRESGGNVFLYFRF